MNAHRAHHHGGSRGAALLIAVAALSLVALLGAALLARAQADVRRAERLVERTEGDHLVEIAVSAAWAGIIDGEPSGFTGSGATDAGNWTFTAGRVADHWVVQVDVVTETDDIEARVVVAREPLLPYALVVADATTGPLNGRVDGRVAITGAATFGGRTPGDIQELVGPDAECRGCDNPVHVAGPGPTTPLPSLPTAPCPAVDDVVTGALAGGFHYECNDVGTITIDGAVTTDAAVVLAFGPDTLVRVESATLNVGGPPATMFITVASDDDTALTIIDSELHGVLTVPDGRTTSDGFRWRGTVATRDLRTVDGSELTGQWSDDLETLGHTGWRITDWQTTR